MDEADIQHDVTKMFKTYNRPKQPIQLNPTQLHLHALKNRLQSVAQCQKLKKTTLATLYDPFPGQLW